MGTTSCALQPEIPIRIAAEVFPLQEANRALNALKNDAIRGAAVLQIS
jgi:D-arabinose 1-dehydrogenase-like Zn-dependent alcohol dehydrogenase